MGIGKATAMALAREGVKVAICVRGIESLVILTPGFEFKELASPGGGHGNS